jgi:cysteine-rich repeat protein
MALAGATSAGGSCETCWAGYFSPGGATPCLVVTGCGVGQVADVPGATTSSTCRTICGDGLRVAPERCDDGGLYSGDGCNSTCGVEAGWSCRGGSSTAPDLCLPDTPPAPPTGGAFVRETVRLSCSLTAATFGVAAATQFASAAYASLSAAAAARVAAVWLESVTDAPARRLSRELAAEAETETPAHLKGRALVSSPALLVQFRMQLATGNSSGTLAADAEAVRAAAAAALSSGVLLVKLAAAGFTAAPGSGATLAVTTASAPVVALGPAPAAGDDGSGGRKLPLTNGQMAGIVVGIVAGVGMLGFLVHWRFSRRDAGGRPPLISRLSMHITGVSRRSIKAPRGSHASEAQAAANEAFMLPSAREAELVAAAAAAAEAAARRPSTAGAAPAASLQLGAADAALPAALPVALAGVAVDISPLAAAAPLAAAPVEPAAILPTADPSQEAPPPQAEGAAGLLLAPVVPAVPAAPAFVTDPAPQPPPEAAEAGGAPAVAAAGTAAPQPQAEGAVATPGAPAAAPVTPPEQQQPASAVDATQVKVRLSE